MSKVETMPAQEEWTEVNERLADATPIEILRWGGRDVLPAADDGDGVRSRRVYPVTCWPRSSRGCGSSTWTRATSSPRRWRLRDRIAERYGIEVELVRPDTTVAEYEATHGGPLYVANPDQCCHDRKIVPLRARWSRVTTPGSRRSGPTSRRTGPKAKRRGLGREVRPGEGQPAAELDAARRLGVRRRQQGAVQPAARPGLSLDRLLALHAGRSAAGEDERAGRWAGQAKTECGLHSLDSSQL